MELNKCLDIAKKGEFWVSRRRELLDSQLRACVLQKIKPDSFYKDYFASAKKFLLDVEKRVQPEFAKKRREGPPELRNFKINGPMLRELGKLTSHFDPLVPDVAENGMEIFTHFGRQPHECPIDKPVSLFFGLGSVM